ncbi:MAG: HAD family hydrolase [Lachnospiraceae bacterium]|nr:HAD family hydrolase [Lachnospiraceae bacterium]
MFLFDLDGTTGDTLESIGHTAKLAFEEFGIEPQPIPLFRYFAGDGADVMIRRALERSGVTDPETADRVTARYRELFQEGCVYNVTSFPGLPKTLEKLKEQGHILVVCSNKDHTKACKVINAIYGEGFFDLVLGLSEEMPAKPDPTMPLFAVSKFSVLPEDCIYVGDTNTDMKCGKAAGMFTVGVTWGFREKEELLAAGADRIITGPEELLDFT